MLDKPTYVRGGAWRVGALLASVLSAAIALVPARGAAQDTSTRTSTPAGSASPAPVAATGDRSSASSVAAPPAVLEPASAAPANGALPRAMSLADALTYARAHHPQLAEAEARVHASRAAVDVPRAQWLPRVGAVVELFAGSMNNSTAANLSSAYVALPRIGATTVNAPVTEQSFVPYPSSVVGVGLTQQVLDFGRIGTQVAAADAAVDVDRHHAANDRLDVELAVREAYFAVLAAHAVVQAASEAHARARAHLALAQAWVERGLRPRIELVRAEAEVARYDVARIRATAALATTQHLLAATVGLAEPALDAAGELAAQPALPSLLDALQQAAARDPVLLELAARLRAQQAQSRALDAQQRPDLVLTAAVSGRGGGAPPSAAASNALPGEGLLPLVPNYHVALVLNVPLFDGVADARARASRAQEQVLRAQAGVARQRQVARIEQAYVDVQVAQATLPALERALDAARANHAQAEARFQAGLGTSVELADGEALRTEAEIALAQGRFALARARAVFDRVIAEDR